MIDNRTFIRTVFGVRPPSEVVWVASFPQDPHSEDAQWGGMPYNAWAKLPPENNNYFAISTFTGNPVRRRIANFCATSAIVIDDVGTKIDSEAIKLAPSWVLETSPGNFHYGYILRPKVTDPEFVLRVQKSLIYQGLLSESDPGMANVTRYMRLPVGSNSKGMLGKPFKQIMHVWEPGLAYQIDAIIDCYGLKIDEVPPRHISELPPGMEDPYLKAIAHLGCLKTTVRGNAYDITCPWVEEHTNQVDSGTAYLSPCGFKCHHGHCHEKTFKDFKHWLFQQGVDTNKIDAMIREQEAAVEKEVRRRIKQDFDLYCPERRIHRG